MLKSVFSDSFVSSIPTDLRNPQGIHIDGLELTPLASNTPTASTDDFFDTWDKPSPAQSKPSTPKPQAPPSIGKPTTTGPRTVTSSSLRAQPITRPTPTARTSGTGPKVSKLGAKKATTGINFEEAQKKAKEEEERIKRLGYDKLREEEEAKAVKEREAAERRAKSDQISRSSTPLSTSNGTRKIVDDKPPVARLGFGQTAGQAVVAQPKAWVIYMTFADNRRAAEVDDVKEARTKFGNQKGTSPLPPHP